MFDIDTCLAYITGYSAKKISDAFNERLSKRGVTKVQWIALYYVGKYEKISQVELANYMNVKPSTVARLIDRMEREEYLTRLRSSEDRRVIYLTLSEKGRKLREELLPEGQRMSELVRQGISDEDIAVFKNVLKTMADNANKEEI
ncbi:MarR family transcriptional regulator [Clostridium bovifaecis]|uniref:MarR family transcriptional regulator n=1 Tax=Clostridium bovifaecis TaxID=2184719 RepID=A0A6I6EZ82_9CLOT|nr:MarR family transcriptional regulator [Clostridium bovifaecis]